MHEGHNVGPGSSPAEQVHWGAHMSCAVSQLFHMHDCIDASQSRFVCDDQCLSLYRTPRLRRRCWCLLGLRRSP